MFEQIDGYDVFHADEAFHHKCEEKSVKLKLMILSRIGVDHHAVVKHDEHAKKSIRYKNYNNIDISFHYIDIKGVFGDKDLRLFNVHFECVTSPDIRRKRFLQTTEYHSDDKVNIVCGDFNNFGRFWISPFVWWLFGAHSAKCIFQNEHKAMSCEIEKKGMKNPHNGFKTFKKLPLQLDYTLIPEKMEVQERGLIKFDHSSDHDPIFIKISIEADYEETR
jgi:hypothetical protein